MQLVHVCGVSLHVSEVCVVWAWWSVYIMCVIEGCVYKVVY